VTVHREAARPGAILFTGAVQYRDGSRRLGRTLSAKAVQVRGPWPAWIRVDRLDGLFQFTDWAKTLPQERLAAIAAAIRFNVQWPGNAEGVVLSTGPAVSLGATNATTEDATVQTSDGALVRRLLAPHLVRDTLVIPLRDHGDSRVGWWARAYGREPEWLDQGLERAGQPHLAHLWKDPAAAAGRVSSGDRWRKLTRAPAVQDSPLVARICREPIATDGHCQRIAPALERADDRAVCHWQRRLRICSANQGKAYSRASWTGA
jgi:hypothetical protein